MPTPTSIITLKLDFFGYKNASGAIGRLNRRTLLKELTVPMDKIARIAMKASKRSFATQADPTTGRRWAPLSAMTKRRREFPGKPILQQRGRLKSSIDYKIIPKTRKLIAVVGTQVRYSTIHQDGLNPNVQRIGNLRIVYGPVPPRPFIGVSGRDKLRIQDTMKRFMKWYSGPTGRSKTRLATKKIPFKGFGGAGNRWGRYTEPDRTYLWGNR